MLLFTSNNAHHRITIILDLHYHTRKLFMILALLAHTYTVYVCGMGFNSLVSDFTDEFLKRFLP